MKHISRNKEKFVRKILVLCLTLVFVWGCAGIGTKLENIDTKPTLSKYKLVVYENNRFLPDKEFKVYVLETIKGTGYIDIMWDKCERLHKTYISRAWVYYEK